MAPESVTVPAVVLSSPTLPPKMAETLPACRPKFEALVKMPVVPLMLPPVNCTPATVSLKVAISSVPPETLTLAVLAITSLAPYAKVPACTSVSPV